MTRLFCRAVPKLPSGCTRRLKPAGGSWSTVDYDADGMTGTAVLKKCLDLLGADVGYYVPSRMEEGYGLNHEAIRSLAKQNAQVVVTVDCGIASVDEAETARESGIELIITDHHEPGSQLPQAVAVVHPRLPGVRLSVRRLERVGRGPETRLGPLPEG